MTSRPRSVTVTMIFVLLNALIWLAFGAIVAVGAHPALPALPVVRWGMAGLSLLTAATLAGLFFALGRRSRLAYFLALALFFAISLLTAFDEVGLVDLAVIAANLVPLILLLKDRSWHLDVPVKAQ